MKAMAVSGHRIRSVFDRYSIPLKDAGCHAAHVGVRRQLTRHADGYAPDGEAGTGPNYGHPSRTPWVEWTTLGHWLTPKKRGDTSTSSLLRV